MNGSFIASVRQSWFTRRSTHGRIHSDIWRPWAAVSSGGSLHSNTRNKKTTTRPIGNYLV